MTRLGFGIVGCGSAALPVCAALSRSAVARLARVYDLDAGLAGDLAERYGAPAATSLDDLLADPAVQAVYVAVPHRHLAPLARQALEAGRHALVEKPMALSTGEAEALTALAVERGLTLGVFYELRHHPAVALACALARGGAIGEVQGVRLQTLIDKPLTYWEAGYSGRSRSPWRGQRAEAGGGVVLMNSSHLLDAARFITGLEVVRVAAETATLAAPGGVEVEDAAVATLRYANGALGSLTAGAHVPGARLGAEHIDIWGSLGQLQVPDPYGLGHLRVFLRRPWGEVPEGEWVELPDEPADVFSEAVEGFAEAVLDGLAPPASGHDARQVLAIVTALYRAASEGVTVSVE